MDRKAPRAEPDRRERSPVRGRTLPVLFTLFASAGLILSPFAAGCGAAAKVNGIVAGVAAAVLGALGIRSPSAQRALRSLAVGLCLAALLMPRALAPWSYDVFAISIFATSFVGG